MAGEIFLALGTNIGDKRQNLLESIRKLEENGIKFLRSSPIYKTPALLLPNSSEYWNIPFLNCIIEVDTNKNPEELLDIIKKIEKEMGRDFNKKWSPRPIDIDILLYKNVKIDTEKLKIPHYALYDRYFLIDALNFLKPDLIKNKNIYTKEHQPAFMGILNITPDSFSDGGIYNNINNFSKTFDEWCDKNVSIVDIGAESTNPKATRITQEEELERLKNVFNYIKNKKYKYFKPILSIDTYHYETAKVAIENGFELLNDVSGLEDEKFIDLLKANKHINYCLMHSLSVPPRKDLVLDKDCDAIVEIEKWLNKKLDIFDKNNISLDRIIFDPGFGFGKDCYQSIKILREIEKFHKYGIKILIGHSRKSFIKKYDEDASEKRDFESLGITLSIANKVDIIRTHTPLESQEALLIYNSIR